MGYNYLTKKEAEMEPKLVDAQIALGLKTCKTGKDVLNLLEDVRLHERDQIKKYVKSEIEELGRKEVSSMAEQMMKSGRIYALKDVYGKLLRRLYYG